MQSFTFQSGSQLTTLSGGAFNATAISEIDLSNCTNLTTISENTFQDCANLTTVKFPNAINTIGNYCFQNVKTLANLDLSNLTSSSLAIGANAFDGTAFTTIDTIAPSSTTTRATVAAGTLALPQNKAITLGSATFQNMPNLTSVKIESTSNSTTTVRNLFANDAKLAKIDLSKCQLGGLINDEGRSEAPSATNSGCFNGTAIKTIKIGNLKGAAAQDGELILADVVTAIGTGQLAGMSQLTTVDLSEATKLTQINNNP